DGFPITQQDQTRAHVTLRAEAKGELQPEKVTLERVDISRARIELPEVKKKDVQDLEPPKNVTFVRNGVPIESEEESESASTGGSGSSSEEKKKRLAVSAVIHAPGNLFVSGEDFHLELGLSDGFKVVSDEEPSIYGTVHVQHGDVSLFGRDFKL